MTTVNQPVVSDQQALILAQHAVIVQGGFSTPENERARCLADAARYDDPQAFIDATVEKFAAEVRAAQAAETAASQPAAPAKPQTEAATRFEWQGEFLDLTPEEGYQLLAEYRAAAAALHAAKERAKAIELRIQERVGGYENARINGQVVITWPWVDTTSFDAKAFKDASPQHKELYQAFLVTKETRRFKVDGTVGVD